jgi:NACHT domain
VSRAGSRGGSANEAGSEHRSAIAAYIAAHGLAGRGLEAAGYPETGPTPVTLAFETGDSVDDIACGLADSTMLWLQAKRACGADTHLAATVTQWAGQVARLKAGDRIGLATAEPKGKVRKLGAALDRRRRPVPGDYTTAERQALDAVRKRFPAGTFEETAESALDAAIVMTVAASGPADEGFRSVANLLDGVVVPRGRGSAAITALQRAFQAQARAGTGSDLDEWLRILEAAGVEVISDADGGAGQRRRAELDAIAAHRARLATRDGVLEFSLLADDLPPMTYGPLADTFRVSVEGHEQDGGSFLITARRWPRMLLAGLPGMGKTTALEQAAARWAKDPRAPVPVRVPLRDLARRRPRRAADITLSVLLEIATDTAPERERPALRKALERAVQSGEATLLLDGLDECQDLRAVVADGVAEIVRGLPEETGAILASRGSALTAAQRLAFPKAQLIEPQMLEYTLQAIVSHAAEAWSVPETDREQWVAERVHRLDDIRRTHHDLWRVPLLATLLTLLVIRHEAGTLPASRARLLADAVEGTVRRWEAARLWETRHYPRLDSPAQLLDGYAQIAHAVADVATVASATSVRDTVAAMLAARWGLAPAAAEERARDIVWFWDEHVGVFVTAPDESRIEPRSRVFAETGNALWAARQDTATQRAWIATALSDDDHREPLLLAAGLSPEITTELIDISTHTADAATRSRGLLWAADAITDGATAPAASVMNLLIGLAGAASDTPLDDDVADDSPRTYRAAIRTRWAYALRIAITPTQPAQRPARDALLADLPGGHYEQVLSAALTALTDARADSQDELDPEQEASVCRLLDMELPERPPALEPVDRPGPIVLRAVEDLRPGHHTAAEQAIRYLPQLGPEAVTSVYAIAHRGTVNEYERIRDRLTAAGHQDPEPPGSSLDMGALAERFEHLWDGWKEFLAAAASLATHLPLTPADGWRYPALAALDDLLDTRHATLVGIDYAFTSDAAMLPAWITAVAHAAGLDLPTLATQASAALQAWDDGDKDVVEVIFAPPPSAAPEPEPSRLDAADIEFLTGALAATSDWIADIAYRLLLNARNPEVAEGATALSPGLTPDRRRTTAVLSVTNHSLPPEAAARLLDSDKPAIRAGAATAARMYVHAGSPQSTWETVLNRARADDDMTVQFCAGVDVAVATTAICWSCLRCGAVNDAALDWCASCDKGRPGRHGHLPAAP